IDARSAMAKLKNHGEEVRAPRMTVAMRLTPWRRAAGAGRSDVRTCVSAGPLKRPVREHAAKPCHRSHIRRAASPWRAGVVQVPANPNARRFERLDALARGACSLQRQATA